jgi:hypothetical protein
MVTQQGDGSTKLLYWILGAVAIMLQATTGVIISDLRREVRDLRLDVTRMELVLTRREPFMEQATALAQRVEALGHELRQHYRAHAEESAQMANRFNAHERALSGLKAPGYRQLVPEEYGGP